MLACTGPMVLSAVPTPTMEFIGVNGVVDHTRHERRRLARFQSDWTRKLDAYANAAPAASALGASVAVGAYRLIEPAVY